MLPSNTSVVTNWELPSKGPNGRILHENLIPYAQTCYRGFRTVGTTFKKMAAVQQQIVAPHVVKRSSPLALVNTVETGETSGSDSELCFDTPQGKVRVSVKVNWEDESDDSNWSTDTTSVEFSDSGSGEYVHPTVIANDALRSELRKIRILHEGSSLSDSDEEAALEHFNPFAAPPPLKPPPGLTHPNQNVPRIVVEPPPSPDHQQEDIMKKGGDDSSYDVIVEDAFDGVKIEELNFSSDDEGVAIWSLFDDIPDVKQGKKAPSEAMRKMGILLKKRIAVLVKEDQLTKEKEAVEKEQQTPDIQIDDSILDYYRVNDPQYYIEIKEKIEAQKLRPKSTPNYKTPGRTGNAWDDDGWGLDNQDGRGGCQNSNGGWYNADPVRNGTVNPTVNPYTRLENSRQMALEAFNQLLIDEQKELPEDQQNIVIQQYTEREYDSTTNEFEPSFAMSLVRHYGYNLPRVGKFSNILGDWGAANIMRKAWKQITYIYEVYHP